ncbi:MAG: hypothetical protein M1837_004861 [Sclerophora amabilis]|nr:MAG: hypothetical protein M1837_004861 [Sclerophora amabilis]
MCLTHEEGLKLLRNGTPQPSNSTVWNKVNGAADEVDLYEVLGLSRGASKSEIKKAYHKAALTSHPDKVAESERAEADIKFKGVSQAYEILYDDEKRELYDAHGMSAFEPGRGSGMGDGVGLDDILQQMFGMGGGMPPGFGEAPGPRKPRKGRDEEQKYEVTLEDLYKGKTSKFTSTKNVVCGVCKGSGGKEHAKSRQCAPCQGRGSRTGLRSVGPGLVTQTTTTCHSCDGAGKVFREKDRTGERIVLEGEADQVPDQQPGDIVFVLSESEHTTFTRAGQDLLADLNISLAEALCGFSRVVLKHLDGRGIHIEHPQGRVFVPGQTLKISGEGMPYKRSDTHGDLYLTVKIQFPKDGWLKDQSSMEALQKLLPESKTPISAETIDEVEYDAAANIDEFGRGSNDARNGSNWAEVEDDENEGESAQAIAIFSKTATTKVTQEAVKMGAAKKHVPIVKKRTKRFNRHQSDTFMCVDRNWRKPKGIDNRVRRRFKGQIAMPSIGFGSNKKTRHMMPSGHKAFLVRNPSDVDLLLMHNKTYAAEIGHAVSSRKRIDIIAKAKQLGVKVTNPKARVTTEV